jgi:YHS domain-containing protein
VRRGGVLCPVCGLGFSVSEATPVVTLRGKDHHVCTSECARKLRSNPPKYGVPTHEPKVRAGRR